MSASLRTTRLFNAAARRSAVSATQRMGFRTSAAMWAGKESALHQENRAEEAEAAKQDSVQKAKAGKGHWKDTLASDSESVVKADRGEVEASEETIKKLQEESKKLKK